MKKKGTAAVVLALMSFTLFGGYAQAAPIKGEIVATAPMTTQEASVVSGEGWLLCAGGVAGAIGLSGSFWGALTGAALIACTCNEYLDYYLSTNFTDACY